MSAITDLETQFDVMKRGLSAEVQKYRDEAVRSTYYYSQQVKNLLRKIDKMKKFVVCRRNAGDVLVVERLRELGYKRDDDHRFPTAEAEEQTRVGTQGEASPTVVLLLGRDRMSPIQMYSGAFIGSKAALVTVIDGILNRADHPEFRAIAVKELNRLKDEVLGREGEPYA